MQTSARTTTALPESDLASPSAELKTGHGLDGNGQDTPARAEAPAEQPRQSVQGKVRAPRGRKPFLVLASLAVVVLAVIGSYLLLTANQQSTDDAEVEADIVPIGARVGGQVLHVFVRDNERVKQGELLVQVDDADYLAKEQQAEAQVATAQAQARAADAQVQVATASAKGGLTSAKALVYGSSEAVTSAGAQIAAAQAGLQRAQAEAKKAKTDLARVQRLFHTSAVSQQAFDNTQTEFDTAEAAVAQAQAQLNAAEQAKRVAESQVTEAQGRLFQSKPIDAQIAIAQANDALAHARVKSAQAALKLAKLQLSYTKIKAPGDGMVSKLSVHEGQLIQRGQPVAEFVPKATYVVANFKETQIGRMRAGQKAEVSIDAYPGKDFEGKVESLSGGTGARFALLPPDNASGNFVKVVQRVPVRVEWTIPPSMPMRAGLSADVTVYLK